MNVILRCEPSSASLEGWQTRGLWPILRDAAKTPLLRMTVGKGFQRRQV
jgi:hypothetical protein